MKKIRKLSVLLILIFIPVVISQLDMTKPNLDAMNNNNACLKCYDQELIGVKPEHYYAGDAMNTISGYRCTQSNSHKSGNKCLCDSGYCSSGGSCIPEKQYWASTGCGNNNNDNYDTQPEYNTNNDPEPEINNNLGNSEEEYENNKNKRYGRECGANSWYEKESNQCRCNEGYYHSSMECVPITPDMLIECGVNSEYNKKKKVCECVKGYAIYTTSVGCEKIYCGENAYYGVSDDDCFCNEGYAIGLLGYCVPFNQALIERNTGKEIFSFDEDDQKIMLKILYSWENTRSDKKRKEYQEMMQNCARGYCFQYDDFFKDIPELDGYSDEEIIALTKPVLSEELEISNALLKGVEVTQKEIDKEKIDESDLKKDFPKNGQSCDSDDPDFIWFNGKCILLNKRSCSKYWILGPKKEDYNLFLNKENLKEEVLKGVKGYKGIIIKDSSTYYEFFTEDLNPLYTGQLGFHLGTTTKGSWKQKGEKKFADAVLEKQKKIGHPLAISDLLTVCLELEDGKVSEAILTCHNSLRNYVEKVRHKQPEYFDSIIARHKKNLKNPEISMDLRMHLNDELYKDQELQKNAYILHSALQKIRETDNTGAWYHLFGTMVAGFEEESKAFVLPGTGKAMVLAEHGGPKEHKDRVEYCWDTWGVEMGKMIYNSIE
ncbi:hypothetical protein HOD20_02510 [archaeon]|jgi:hypothetical protein|nr:hypothetical protein [archaeon]MBT4647374.1 hypothetical protein [archaeon]MBT6821377.1 hypothetical protein [archaeon]